MAEGEEVRMGRMDGEVWRAGSGRETNRASQKSQRGGLGDEAAKPDPTNVELKSRRLIEWGMKAHLG